YPGPSGASPVWQGARRHVALDTLLLVFLIYAKPGGRAEPQDAARRLPGQGGPVSRLPGRPVERRLERLNRYPGPPAPPQCGRAPGASGLGYPVASLSYLREAGWTGRAAGCGET